MFFGSDVRRACYNRAAEPGNVVKNATPDDSRGSQILRSYAPGMDAGTQQKITYPKVE